MLKSEFVKVLSVQDKNGEEIPTPVVVYGNSINTAKYYDAPICVRLIKEEVSDYVSLVVSVHRESGSVKLPYDNIANELTFYKGSLRETVVIDLFREIYSDISILIKKILRSDDHTKCIIKRHSKVNVEGNADDNIRILSDLNVGVRELENGTWVLVLSINTSALSASGNERHIARREIEIGFLDAMVLAQEVLRMCGKLDTMYIYGPSEVGIEAIDDQLEDLFYDDVLSMAKERAKEVEFVKGCFIGKKGRRNKSNSNKTIESATTDIDTTEENATTFDINDTSLSLSIIGRDENARFRLSHVNKIKSIKFDLTLDKDDFKFICDGLKELLFGIFSTQSYLLQSETFLHQYRQSTLHSAPLKSLHGKMLYFDSHSKDTLSLNIMGSEDAQEGDITFYEGSFDQWRRIASRCLDAYNSLFNIYESYVWSPYTKIDNGQQYPTYMKTATIKGRDLSETELQFSFVATQYDPSLDMYFGYKPYLTIFQTRMPAASLRFNWDLLNQESRPLSDYTSMFEAFKCAYKLSEINGESIHITNNVSSDNVTFGIDVVDGGYSNRLATVRIEFINFQSGNFKEILSDIDLLIKHFEGEINSLKFQ